MRKYGYEPAPLVVGLVLGTVMERSFRQTLIISGGRVESLWEPPLCMTMWIITLLAILLPIVIPPLKARIKGCP
jgi:putative tricarboxylic transport membrane protein